MRTKRHYFVLCSIVLCLFSFQQFTFAQDGWVQQTSGTTVDLSSVQFLNGDVGWAVGDTVILKTMDGGNTWETVWSSNMEYNSVCFIDENIGWIAGSIPSLTPPSEKEMAVFKSTDGGSIWAISLIDSSTMSSTFFACQFIDQYTGWAVGYGWIDAGGAQVQTISKTTDGGETWIVLPSPGPPINYGTFTSIHFVDSNKGYATLVGYSGYGDPLGSGAIYYTTTGGSQWDCQWGCQEGEVQLYDVFFISENIGWVVGEEGTILKTINGGTNWLLQTSNDSVKLQSTYFVDSLTGWICGDQGKIIYTTNGGTNWFKQQSGTTSYLNAICFIDENNGWAVGDNGIIIHTTTGGAVSVEGETNGMPGKYNLTQNYPNPFNPNTKINFSIPSSSFVTLKVYDVLGNEIETLVNEEKPVGTYEITWYAGNLPSGVYFYQLKAGEFIETKKMLLLR